MEIVITYQDKQVSLSRPETRYGSNLQTFIDMVSLAFEGIGLDFVGEITERVQNE